MTDQPTTPEPRRQSRPDPEFPLWSEMPEPALYAIVENQAGHQYQRGVFGWSNKAGVDLSWRDFCLAHGPFKLRWEPDARGATTTPACQCDATGCPVHDDTAVTCDTCPPEVTIPGYDAKAHEVRNPGHRVIPVRTRLAEAEGDVPTETTPEPEWRARLFHDLTDASDGQGRLNRGDARDIATSYIEPLHARIARLEADVRALGGDPDRTVDPRDHEAAIKAMREEMTEHAETGRLRLGEATDIAERHMLRMAQGATDATTPEEVREVLGVSQVPTGEIRDGDTVTVSFTAHAEHVPDASGLWLSEFGQGIAPSMFLTQDDVTVSRPVSPLPDQAGAVGTATVRGRPGVRVMLAESNDGRPWFSARMVAALHWHPASDLTDYEPELPAAGVNEGGKP